MGRVFEGKFDGSGLRTGIVASRFNDLITGRLVTGTKSGNKGSDAAEGLIEMINVLRTVR